MPLLRRAGLVAVVAVAAGAHSAVAQRIRVGLSGVAGSVGSAVSVQGVLEEGVGIWYGGRLDLRAGPVVVEVSEMVGTLAPSSGAAGFDQDGGEARVVAGVVPLSWLAVEGTYEVRAFDSPAGYQKWTASGAGARVWSQLGVPALRGYARIAYLFGVSVSGEDAPDLALGFEAGVDLTPARSPITLGAFYRLERFDFPATGSARVQQFDMLGVRGGISFARKPGVRPPSPPSAAGTPPAN